MKNKNIIDARDEAFGVMVIAENGAGSMLFKLYEEGDLDYDWAVEKRNEFLPRHMATDTEYPDLSGDVPIWLPRPVVTTFPDNMSAPAIFTPSSGETIHITNEVGSSAETSDPMDPIEVVSAGTVTVTVRAPWPSQTWTGIVEVG